MYQRRRVRIVLAVLTLLCLTLITVDFRSGGSEGEGPLGALRAVASSVFGPIQEGLATVVRPIGNAVGGVGDVFTLRAENERLKAQLEASRERRLSYDEVLQQNRELRELLDIREASDFDVVAAQVIGRAPSNLEFSVAIDVGTDDGVRRDMAVINGDGLVGRVVQATASNARVLLAVDPTFGAAARISQTREVGSLIGAGADPFVFEPFDPEAEVVPGQEVVTAVRSNGIFPDGIPIGTVADPGDADGLLTRRITVAPFVDFTRLDFVLVVTFTPDYEFPVDPIRPDAPFTPPDVPTDLPTDPLTPGGTETPTDGATPGTEPTPTDTETDSDQPQAAGP